MTRPRWRHAAASLSEWTGMDRYDVATSLLTIVGLGALTWAMWPR